MSNAGRWRGLKALVHDMVAGASAGIERAQKEMAGRTFTILEEIPLIAGPTRVVHALHDLAVTGTHVAIHLGNDVVAAVVDAVIDSLAPDEPK